MPPLQNIYQQDLSKEDLKTIFNSHNRIELKKGDFLFREGQIAVSIITDSATNRYLALQDQSPQIIIHALLKYIATHIGVTDTSLSRIGRELVKA